MLESIQNIIFSEETKQVFNNVIVNKNLSKSFDNIRDLMKNLNSD